MMYRLLFVVYFLMAVSLKGFAQTAAFVHFSSDAQVLGAGNSDLLSIGNPLTVFSDLSGSHLSENRLSIGYGFRNVFDDKYNLHSMGLYYRLSPKHVIGGGAKFFIHPAYEQMNSDGALLKSFSPREMLFTLGYSYLLAEHFSISIMSNFINSDLDGTNNGSAITFNAGLLFHDQDWFASCGIQQLGSKLKYDENSYNIPARFNLAVSRSYNFTKNHKLVGSVQGKYQFLPSGSTGLLCNFGVLYSMKDKWFIRGGYQLASNRVEYDFASCGVGVNLLGLNISGAYLFSKEDYVNQTYCLSVSYSIK